LNIRQFFGAAKQKIKGKIWDWANFKTTKGFPISDELLDWVIGQDKAIEECKLCIDEWIQKLLRLKKQRWWQAFEDPMGDKPPPKEWLPSGPFLLMLGDAGTGKSLIGRALSTYMTKLYKKYKIELNDVVCWKNTVIPSEPRISIHPSPKGGKLVRMEKKKLAKRGRLTNIGIKLGRICLGGFGAFLILLGLIFWLKPWIDNPLIEYSPPMFLRSIGFLDYTRLFLPSYLNYFGIGGSLVFVSVMVGWLRNIFRMQGNKGIGGAEATDAPKLLIDNSSGRAPFIDATGHGSAQLFGSIAWDPYQTGGLGTPEHQRASAGDVHRAHLGILYIDEVKNLTGAEAVTLLTVLEDGQLSIALRSLWHGGDTAAMSVSTEPVPSMVFLVAAGNLDSIPQIHFALMDRIEGYGKVVYMNNDMLNTIENRRKCVQFIAQEIKRFNLLPFSREACIEVIEESRRKAGRKDRLSTKFRPLISILKTASVLAFNDGKKVVEAKYVKEAIDEHCKTIQLQVIERAIENQGVYMIVNPKAKPIIGQIHGLAAISDAQNRDVVGSVLPIRASILDLEDTKKEYINVTGVNVHDESWIQQSIAKMFHVLRQLYTFEHGIGIHMDFAQKLGVDGPSAGIAMMLTLASIVEDKPIRQDVAVTGEINIAIKRDENKKWEANEVIVTPVGCIHQKIQAAERWGFKKVLIPKVNYDKNIKPKDYKIKIVGCRTLEDYKKEIFDADSNSD